MIGIIISEIGRVLSGPWVKVLLKAKQWLTVEERSGVGGKAGFLNSRFEAKP